MAQFSGQPICVVNSTSGGPYPLNAQWSGDHSHDTGGRVNQTAKVISYHSGGRVVVQFADGEKRDYHITELSS